MSFARNAVLFAAVLTIALAAGSQDKAAPTPVADPLHAWVAGSDPAALEAWVNQRLKDEDAEVAKLVAVTGPRTVENTLRPFDEAQNQLALAGDNAYLHFSLADSAALRDKGQIGRAHV